jgi:PKD repeat protein
MMSRFGRTVRRRLRSVLLVLALLTPTTVLGVPVYLDRWVDLGIRNISQLDLQWARLAAGPNHDVSIGACGSILAVLSTFLNDGVIFQGIPHFGVTHQNRLIEPPFNPAYVDEFLHVGPFPDRDRPAAPGYKPGKPYSCGAVRPKPLALENVSIPPASGLPTGVRLRQLKGFGATVRRVVNRNLLGAMPTIVVHSLPGGGRHAQLIVGWDPIAQTYLVLDPLQATGVSEARPPEAIDVLYWGWESRVHSIIWLENVFDFGLSFQVDDDPAPIEFLMTSPDGRRTGYDPDTGGTLDEDDAVYPLEIGEWADPLGEVESDAAAKFMSVSRPGEGTYRLSVIGTQTGNALFTLSTVSGGEQTVLETFDGPVAPGTLIKYEARLVGPGAPAVTPVTNFTPEAKAGGDAKGVAGEPIQLDASRSFDVDGAIVAYAWDLGDGTAAAGGQVSHAYAAPGTYAVTLTVSDDQGGTGTAMRTVTIVDPSRRGFGAAIDLSRSADEVADVPRIAADGSNVYVAWGDLTGPYYQMYENSFAASGDGGATFGDPMTLAGPASTFDALGPCEVAAAGTRAYAVWRGGSANEVVFRRSADRGGTFGPPIGLGTAGGFSDPQIAAVGDRVYVVWAAGDILLRASADGGATFGPVRNLSNTPLPDSDSPHIVTVGSRVYVAYQEFTATGTAILLTVSADGGASFGTPINLSTGAGTFVGLAQLVVVEPHVYILTQQPGAALRVSADGGATFGSVVVLRDNVANAVLGTPRIAVSGSNVYVTGTGRALGDPQHSDVFLRASNDHGTSFGGAVRLSATTGGVVPDVVASGDHVYVGWSEQRDMDPDPDWFALGPVSVHFRLSPDGGATFDDIVTLADETGGGAFAMNALGGRVSIAWSEASTGNREIFFASASFGQGARPIANPSGPYLGWATSDESPAAVRFDASRSLDPEGRALTARWDFGDGTSAVTADAANPVFHAYAEEGRYTVTLVVTAGGTDSEPATTTAEIFPALPGNATVVTPRCAAGGEDVRVSGIVARPALVQNGWDLGRGAIVLDPVAIGIPGASVTVPPALRDLSFDAGFTLPGDVPAGTHAATVDGVPAASFTTPCPMPDNLPPVPHAGGPYAGRVGQQIALDGSQSTDPDGDPLTHTWQFGDGTAGSGARPGHVYTEPGIYVATLVVSDGILSSFPTAGTRSFAKVTVSPDDANDPPACGLASPSEAILWPPSHKRIPVEILGVTDPDGDAVAIAITGVTQDEPLDARGDGNTKRDAVIRGTQALIRAERAGGGNGRVYQVHFVATDVHGAACTGSVVVAVPHSMNPARTPIDDGQLYDSTAP